MSIVSFSPTAWEEYLYWQEQDENTLLRINQLIKDAFDEVEKLETLRNDNGVWSKRIDETNRLVYRISNDIIEIIQCKEHSED